MLAACTAEKRCLVVFQPVVEGLLCLSDAAWNSSFKTSLPLCSGGMNGAVLSLEVCFRYRRTFGRARETVHRALHASGTWDVVSDAVTVRSG